MKAFKKLIESKGSTVEENFINNYEIYNKFMQEAIKLILNEDVTQIQNTLDFIQGKQIFNLPENKDEQKLSKESSQSSEDVKESNKFQILFSEQKGPQIILSDGNKVSTGDKTNWNTVLLDQKIEKNKQYTIKFQIIKNSSVMIGITDKCNFKSHLSRTESAYYLYCNDGIVFHKKQKIKKYRDFDMENVTMIINSKQGYLKFQCKGIPENDLAAENILFAGQSFYPAVSQSSENTVRILESYIEDL